MNDTMAAVPAETDASPPRFPLPCHPLLGHLPAFRRDPLEFLTQCLKTGLDVVPLRMPLLRVFLLLNPDDIERVLVTDHRQFVKPLWLRTPAVRRLLGQGLVTSDGDSWRTQRRACQPAFHPGQLPGYGRTVAALTARMLDGWQSGPRDILQDMTRLTLEIIGRTLLGVEIAPVAGEVSAIMATLMRCFNARAFGLLPLPPSRAEARAVRRLDALVDQLIAEGLAAGAGGGAKTLLARLDSEPGGTVGTHGLREQVKTFLAAGHDSSSLTLTWALLMLSAHPDADAKLAAELQGVLEGRAPMPEDISSLPYTQAVVKETLRLYPPLWMAGRQAARACEIGGQSVPSGALVVTSPWPVQRLARFFPDPDEFRPERWLTGETASLPRCAYFPFGGGPRVCIGQGFAMLESTLILASIAQRVRLTTTGQPDIRPWATMTLRPPANLLMHQSPR